MVRIPRWTGSWALWSEFGGGSLLAAGTSPQDLAQLIPGCPVGMQSQPVMTTVLVVSQPSGQLRGARATPGGMRLGGGMVPVGTGPDMDLPMLPHPQPQISSCSPELSERQSVVGVT